MRQEAFENFDVTDDHLMHLVGIAEDQDGTKFYYTKNSWGTENKKYQWFLVYVGRICEIKNSCNFDS